jgi:protein-S-isoprenylcysteine O-methyltransferase Ste14
VLALFCVLVVGWALGEGLATSPDRPMPGTLALPTGLVLLAGHVTGVVEHVRTGGGSLAGAALLAAGIALRLWSIATLGPLFATALESPRRITSGPYRWLRHPSELGLVLAAAGGALLLGSIAATLAAVALLPLIAVRCRREDYASSASRSSRVIASAPPASDSAASASPRLRSCSSMMRSSTVSRATIR